jgi:hypothetical protein
MTYKRLDEAMTGVTWGIGHAADDDEMCPDILGNGIRLARATLPQSPDKVLRIWFVLDQELGLACLVSIDIDDLGESAEGVW